MNKILIFLKIGKEVEDLQSNLIQQRIIEKVDPMPPHITLYGFESVKDEDFIQNELKQVLKEYKPFTIQLTTLTTSTYNTLQLNVDSKELRELHKKTVLSLSKFIDEDAPSKPKEFYHTFSEKEKENIDRYARPYVMELYQPHITLGRLKGEHPENRLNINTKISSIYLKGKKEELEINLESIS